MSDFCEHRQELHRHQDLYLRFVISVQEVDDDPGGSGLVPQEGKADEGIVRGVLCYY